MAQGSIGWWVIGMYLKSVGIFLTIIIVISLILMQVSQNFTFLWLTFWVKNKNKNSTTLYEPEFRVLPKENLTILDHGVNAVDKMVHAIMNVTQALIHNADAHNINGTVPREQINPFSAGTLRISNDTPVYDDNFYLEVYFGLAGLNLVFTIMRAFLFAYGGVKAASRIHKVLLKVIVKVISN